MVPDPAATAPWPLTQLSALPDVALAPVEKFLMFRFGTRQECHPANRVVVGNRASGGDLTVKILATKHFPWLPIVTFVGCVGPLPLIRHPSARRLRRVLFWARMVTTISETSGVWPDPALLLARLGPRSSFITLKYWVVAGATIHLTTITRRCPWPPILAALAAPHAGMVIFRATFARLSRPMSMAKR